MQRSIVVASFVAFTTASAVDAGVLTYSSRSLVAGISDGVFADSVSYDGLDSWFGSKYAAGAGLIQFAGIEIGRAHV